MTSLVAYLGLVAVACESHSTSTSMWRSIETVECFRLSYDDAIAGATPDMLPGRVALIPNAAGADSGSVVSEADRTDTIGFWRMFETLAYWERSPSDSLLLHFSNGFSGVGFALSRTDSTLLGRATYYSDVVTPGPNPSMRVRGVREACPRSGRDAG